MPNDQPLVVKLADATREQLLAFANKVKGLNLVNTLNTPTLIAKIQQVHHHDDIEIPAEVAATFKDAPKAAAPAGTPPAEPKAKVAKKGGKLPEPKVWVTLSPTEGPGGDRPEFVGGGKGKGMLIPKGKACEIPYRYFEALKNAKKHHYTQSKDANGNIINGEETCTIIQAIPFSVNQMPPREELLAWLEEQGARWEPEIDEYYDRTFQPGQTRAA